MSVATTLEPKRIGAEAPARPARPSPSPWERQSRNLTWSLLALPLAAMLVLFVAPLLVLLYISLGGWADSFNLSGYQRLAVPVYWRLLVFTLQMAVTVTLVCAILAYPIAYLIACFKGRFAQLMALGLFVSLWMSFLARTFAWIVILQRNGIANTFLMQLGIIDAPLSLVYNTTGVYIGMIHIMLPFMIVTLVPTMSAIDTAYIRAGLSLGGRPFQVFWQVFFPLTLPGVVAGSILVFALSFGIYVTPAILGGGRAPTIVLAVRDQISRMGDLQLAAATSMMLLVICLGILIFYNRIVGVDKILERGR